VIGATYFLLRDAIFRGRSFGKLLCGTKIVTYSSGEPVQIGQILVRNILQIVVLAAPFLVGFIIGWPISLISEKLAEKVVAFGILGAIGGGFHLVFKDNGQALWDEKSGTIVVKTSKVS
jgi:uncharacterized RDD family membrane protein YckC